MGYLLLSIIRELWLFKSTLFLRFVHVTLFFELLAQVLPRGLHLVFSTIEQVLPVVEKNAIALALAMGFIVAVLPEVLSVPGCCKSLC